MPGPDADVSGAHRSGEDRGTEHRRARARARLRIAALDERSQQLRPHDPDQPSELGGLDIGLAPASVTPPRTGRQAAWFTVLCSSGVLIILVVLVTLVIAPYRASDRLTGLPHAPDYPQPGPTSDPADESIPARALVSHDSTRPQPTRAAPTPAPPPSARLPSESPAPALPAPGPAVGGALTEIAPETTSGRPTPSPTSSPEAGTGTDPSIPQLPSSPPTPLIPVSPSPPPAGESPAADPVIPPTALVESSIDLLDTLARNPTEALELLEPEAAPPEGFAHWGNVADVVVEDVTPTQDNSGAIATFRVIQEDGRELLERHYLAFSDDTPQPRISEIRILSSTVR